MARCQTRGLAFSRGFKGRVFILSRVRHSPAFAPLRNRRTNAAMKLNVFACYGGYLLSAECMFAPREPTEVYHPVAVIVGLVPCEELPSPLCERVARDIERQQFAFVHADEAKHVRLPMLAMQHPPNTA